MRTFAQRLIQWQQEKGRHHLPWQKPDAYARWLSEIMLQQTQVNTVLGYYNRFLERFPTVQDLANAPQEEVMRLWAGLGYYTRARNLHRCAQMVCENYQGQFPDTRQELEQLPGIGRSTAAAIAAFSFKRREAILDGNVKRVLCRHFLIEGHPSQSAVQKQLWQCAQELLPQTDVDVYTQALMDLGALVCTRNPQCSVCPLKQTCRAFQEQVQGQYPQPKPKKQRPEKHRTFLLYWKDDAVVLQKRTQKGVWQGLYSLPELEGTVTEETLLQRAAQDGFEVKNVRFLEPIIHDFSHYRLHMHPVALALKTQPTLIEPTVWANQEKRRGSGLPAPIQVLLDEFFE